MKKLNKITISYRLKKQINQSLSLLEHIKGATFQLMTLIKKCTSLRKGAFAQTQMSKLKDMYSMKINSKTLLSLEPCLKMAFKVKSICKKESFR